MSTLPDEIILSALLRGDVTLKGEFTWGYNYTFLTQVKDGEIEFLAVYKPQEGEQPLWDFPDNTLAHREVAAYLVSQALGWDFVPPTVFRGDGPFGPGSLQLFIDYDPEYHFFTFREADRQRLRPVALFDLIINNADRKGGHIFFGSDDRIWLIDHGLCFHVEEKLRTVIWDFAGESIPEDLLLDVKHFRGMLDLAGEFHPVLERHLTLEELAAMADRTDQLLASGCFPSPPDDRRAYPFPPV
jgi:uncharacterized repeat protein (TIGR03843 family)